MRKFEENAINYTTQSCTLLDFSGIISDIKSFYFNIYHYENKLLAILYKRFLLIYQIVQYLRVFFIYWLYLSIGYRSLRIQWFLLFIVLWTIGGTHIQTLILRMNVKFNNKITIRILIFAYFFSISGYKYKKIDFT